MNELTGLMQLDLVYLSIENAVKEIREKNNEQQRQLLNADTSEERLNITFEAIGESLKFSDYLARLQEKMDIFRCELVKRNG